MNNVDRRSSLLTRWPLLELVVRRGVQFFVRVLPPRNKGVRLVALVNRVLPPSEPLSDDVLRRDRHHLRSQGCGASRHLLPGTSRRADHPPAPGRPGSPATPFSTLGPTWATSHCWPVVPWDPEAQCMPSNRLHCSASDWSPIYDAIHSPPTSQFIRSQYRTTVGRAGCPSQPTLLRHTVNSTLRLNRDSGT